MPGRGAATMQVRALGLALLAALAAACTTPETGDGTGDGDRDAGEPRAFGMPCKGNSDCVDGWCVESLDGFVCTRPCATGCPSGWDCRAIRGAGESTQVCFPPVDRLCELCSADFQCPDGVCVLVDGEGRCSTRCNLDDCATGYRCEAGTSMAGGEGRFCAPPSGSCTCRTADLGRVRSCETSNGSGACAGVQTCGESGWDACNAATPKAELCNGLDDDCDGLVDDGLPAADPCERAVEGVGTCSGFQVCLGADGWLCSAAVPEAEQCNGKDDDCDGHTDEAFRPGDTGPPFTDAHCGACGNDCAARFANGVGRCAGPAEAPECVVDRCDDGYVRLSDFRCVPIVDTGCRPCAEDRECFGGACVPGPDGEKVCFMPCGAPDPQGPPGSTGACAPSFRCDAETNRCVPASGTCSCIEARDGRVESCARANAAGSCFGVRVCVGDEGWSACSAAEPAAEVCNGNDDDCDGATDELDQLIATDAHCGACGVSCAGAIANASARCVVHEQSARCEVTACAPGWWRASAVECRPAGDDQCAPCVVDADCPTPGDLCLSLDGGRFCGRDCGAANVHGTPEGACPAGYVCGPHDAGGAQCRPLSGSCTCLAPNAGQLRTCSVRNELGACAGVSTCDPAAGWSACSAPAPSVERCNGVDDDCNGAADDVEGRGSACAVTNAEGACPGVLDCVPSGGGGDGALTCVGRSAAAESCNHQDDDCDGETDETFRGAGGGYTLDAHCGACGNDCAARIANGTGHCGGSPEAPSCVVTACAPGFVQVGRAECARPPDVSCQQCRGDADCYDGSCVLLDGRNVCVAPCGADEAGCRAGYHCGDAAGARRCLPDTASCACNAASDGQLRACSRSAAAGTCYGLERCDGSAGWVGCSASEPTAELCNGLDDDCDGSIDEGVVEPAEPCVHENAFGACGGAWQCRDDGVSGIAWTCVGPTPEAEACDYRDNDCDGLTDEAFRVGPEATGPPATDAHCGACGASCAGAIAHAVARCVAGADGATAQCEVARCDAGFYPGGPRVCLAAADRPCTACSRDEDCGTPGDACLTLDGGSFCGRDCGADNLHGTPAGACPGGFTCVAHEDGRRQCEPPSGSCSCLAPNAGQLRACAAQNDTGLCRGSQSCDPASGWSACSAQTPAAERCNGLDDDCNGAADDVLGRGDACALTNAAGTCPGTLDCAAGGASLVCVGRAPAAEACNYSDDDCDGETDEPYRAPDGSWTLDAHCGGCGNDCAARIAHGSGRCGGTAEAPLCVVVACDDGYVQVGPAECALPPDVSCQPCRDDADCFNGSCVELDGRSVCVARCGLGDERCPDGYACGATPDEEGARRCLPVTASCTCNAAADGQFRTCSRAAAAGTCFGLERCDAGAGAGWSGCTAHAPAGESCNGADDDCDGQTDEEVVEPGAPCETTNAHGTCGGAWSCRDPGGAGSSGVRWVCAAAAPAPEVCDYADNDCDGATDEDFRLGDGPLSTDTDCGACGRSCAGTIAHATAGCVVDEAFARCEVLECEEGFFQAGPRVCLPAADDLCAPCSRDEDCVTPGDACLELDGGSFCAHDCSEGNVRGAPAGECPAGYTCDALRDGRFECRPTSSSCTCLPANAGQLRSCSQQNATGLCRGTESCDPESGWSECDAQTPAQETCNGADDDCNGAFDDVAGRGGACANENAAGACPGVRECVAESAQLVCVGRTPAFESCNHLDDDCDGATDETFPGLFDACSVGTGVCVRFGFVDCAPGGATAACNARPADPGVEVCDGLDDDCDGLTDEDARWATKGRPCSAGTGACRADGVFVCDAGDPSGPTVCDAEAGEAGTESCNGLDDDCDGLTDEDVRWANKGRPCAAGTGGCRAEGVYVCDPNDPGGETVCDARPDEPELEVCNGLDDDCDGGTDEGAAWSNKGRPCRVGTGACTAFGVYVCDAGDASGATVCDTEPGEPGDELCNAIDDDCDGATDEGPLWTNLHHACARGAGACRAAGIYVCDPDDAGAEAVCDAVPAEPETESCNGLDDDCDGATDETFPGLGTLCTEGTGACQRTGNVACDADGAGTHCTAVEGAPGVESCNGVDDDCDGDTDAPLVHPDCALTDGVCAGSTQACAGVLGFLPCTPFSYGDTYESGELTCDGLDNDCDGTEDDVDLDHDAHRPVACGGDDCDDANPLVYAGASEICGDGLDDDCDTVTDNRDVDGDDHIAAACGGDDCNDAADTAYRGHVEVCGDGLDNDCDGVVENLDSDGDDFVAAACGGDDCDDGRSGVNPAALEACNGLDDDCNGEEDDKDLDRDGHIDDDPVCGGDDCDDAHDTVNPEQTELCGNAADEDCSGATNDRDLDLDGAYDIAVACGGTDCDDADVLARPGRSEVRDARDNDCDGFVDEGLIASGTIIVTEVMTNPSVVADGVGEWFELFNTGTAPVNLRSWTIKDGAASNPDTFTVDSNLVIEPGGVAVLCIDDDSNANGGVTCNYQYADFTLGNNTTSGASDELILELDGTVLNRVDYTFSFPHLAGRAMQLDPPQYSGTANNTATNWCNTTNNAAYRLTAGDYGTPGRVNPLICASSPAIALISVVPFDGLDDGGEGVTFVGSGLTGLTDVTLGGTSCTSWSVLSDVAASCTTPAHAAGLVSASVVRNASSATKSDAFRYTGVAVAAISGCVLRTPVTLDVAAGARSASIFGRVTSAGVTDTEGAPAGIVAQLGYGPDDADPRADAGWSWSEAGWSADAGAADEFVQTLTLGEQGAYAFTFRFSDDGGVNFVYCDSNAATAFSLGELGAISVSASP